MPHPFLSEEWLDAAEQLRAEYDGRLPPPPVSARINVTVTETPYHPDDLRLHVDTTGGYPLLLRGTQDGADVDVTTSYGVAVRLFVERDPQKVMEAFLQGRLLVRGDLTALMALQQLDVGDVDPAAIELVERVLEMTEVPEAPERA